MRRRASIGIFFFLFALPLMALADTGPEAGSLQLNMSPQYPSPGDTVTVTATDYAPNASSMSYLWSVNGVVTEQGIGDTSLPVIAGSAGSSQNVTVQVSENGTVEDSESVTVRPADVDLIWEGDTSVLPFYIGRPLPNAQSKITVVAMPHIVSGAEDLPANSLIYAWEENGTPMESVSGYGKSSAVFTPPSFGEPFTISVTAETTDGTGVASGTVTITPQTPQVLIYNDPALIGVQFEKRIPSVFPFPGDELSLAAFPIFVSNPNALSYQWMLDGAPFSVDPTQPGLVTFRKTGQESGSHTVTFSFKNPNEFAENATASFSLTF